MTHRGFVGSLLVLIALTVSASAQSGPSVQFFDNNGRPAARAELCTFEAGTFVMKSVYYAADIRLSVLPNPVILDANGRAAIYFAPGPYKLVLLRAGTNTLCDVNRIKELFPPRGSGVLWVGDNIR